MPARRQGKQSPEAGRRPDLEKQVVRVENLLARLPAAYTSGRALQNCPARLPTRKTASSSLHQARRSPRDHAPCTLPVLPAITERHRRLRQNLAIEQAGFEPRGDQSRKNGEARHARGRQHTLRHLPARMPGPERSSRPSSPSHALRLLVSIRQTSRTRMTGAAMTSATHRDSDSSRRTRLWKATARAITSGPTMITRQRIGQAKRREDLGRTHQTVPEQLLASSARLDAQLLQDRLGIAQDTQPGSAAARPSTDTNHKPRRRTRSPP